MGEARVGILGPMKNLILSAALILCSTTAFAQQQRGFGWLGDSGNKRVMMMAPQAWPIEQPAAKSDLSRGMPKVLDQGSIGSCVGHGTASAWSYAHNLSTRDQFAVSRLMIYYEARKAIGTTNWDSGCQIVDAVNWLQRWGSCKESLWPYEISKFKQKAPNAAYTEAKKHQVLSARKIDNTDKRSIRLALTNGYPVIVGSLVYGGIQKITTRNYVLEMPRSGERPIGGHCYLLIGHDDAKKLYRGRNSWGSRWGNSGDFLLPYAYIDSGRITEDCWVIIGVTSSQ